MSDLKNYENIRGNLIMNIKRTLGIGIMSAIIGLSMLVGGTFAYFSDAETTNNTFAAGTIDLAVEPTELVNLDNLKPGDSMERMFELQNNGTLDVEKVLLETSYTINDANNDNTDDFGKHIQVEFLQNVDQIKEVVFETTLHELKNMSPEAVAEQALSPLLDEDGLEAGTVDDFLVKFEFVENGEDQNQFQGDSLNLEWTFNAQQAKGEEK